MMWDYWLDEPEKEKIDEDLESEYIDHLIDLQREDEIFGR